MKPARFDYHAPTTRDEVLELMAQHGHDARLLAGGQSLMPMMNLRLARPAVVVDINRVEGLSGIASDDEGLTVGAMARQRTLERSVEVRQLFPLISDAIPHIAHFQIRNRGTIGGSLAHSDPAAEIPGSVPGPGRRNHSGQQQRGAHHCGQRLRLGTTHDGA